MLTAYVSAGFSPEDFWGSTPREIEAHMKGAALRSDYLAWIAWRGAWASRAERFPGTFDRFMGRKVEPRRQTQEEMLASAMAWHEKLKVH